jgi:ATP-dependent Clp protease ATP-binding subunit ClpA
VKGQSKAIAAVTDILKRASLGLSGILHSSQGQKPKGVLFFAGPTGVGKTELAKSLARLLFGDDTACLRFDMSEFSQAHADQRLFGAPPGYVGYEAGGELTSAVKKNPFSVLLFDEIDKAHPSILDKFLQILEDGRLTSGQGETVFFSECVIIFTSNKGIYRDVPDETDKTGQRMRKQLAVTIGSDPNDLPAYSDLRKSVVTEISRFFQEELGRPELLNRIGNNLVVFDFIRPEVVRNILNMRLERIREFLQEKNGWAVDFAPVVEELAMWAEQDAVEFGGRGIINRLETALLNPLARRLFDRATGDGQNIRVLSVHATDDSRERYDVVLEGE